MYTQGQAVLNRALFPCFDTPAVKCTYSALIEVRGAGGLGGGLQRLGSRSSVGAPAHGSFARAGFPGGDQVLAGAMLVTVLGARCRQVPDGFTAVMSADTWEQRGPGTFSFRMSQPIPSYLVALAIGDLVSAEVGPR